MRKRSKSVTNLHITKVLALGHYKIDYSITLDDDDMRAFNLTDITKLKTYSDIKFIIENLSLWSKIRLTTDNDWINLLLYLNRINTESNKIYLEFISYEHPVYLNDEVKQMLQTVNETNYFFVNETALTPEEQKAFSLTIRFRDRSTVIHFNELEDIERNNNVDNEVQEEGGTKIREITQEEEEAEQNLSGSIFDKVKLTCDSYNYFLSSIGETLETSPYEDFVEFVVDAKLKYGALIVTEYGDHVEYFSDKETMTLLNKLYLITDIFLFDEKEALSNFKKHYEILTKENSKKVYKFGEIEINNYPFGKEGKQKTERNEEKNLSDNEHENEHDNENNNVSENKGETDEHKDEEEEHNGEEDEQKGEEDEHNGEEDEQKGEEDEQKGEIENVNENEKQVSGEEVDKENKKSEIAKEDNKSQMSSRVNSHANVKKNNIYRNSIIPFNHRGKLKLLTEKDIFDYFRFDVACNGGLSILNSKLGIFIDENFSKVTFIEVPMNSKALIFSYDIKPHPKLYPSTLHKVEKYWAVLRGNRNYFKSFFYAGILSIICFQRRKNFGLETLYPAYLKGHELLRRILHLKTKDIEFPDNPKFYIVKLNNGEIDNFLKKQYNGKKEKKFVLDCINLEKSHLKYYVPLFDDNLHEFFDNDVTKKELERKGFINSKGFVNYDPYYREGMGIPGKNNLRYVSGSNPNYVIKKQVEANVKNMNNRILKGPVIATKVKLPAIKCRITEKVNKFRNQEKKCNHKYRKEGCKECARFQQEKNRIQKENREKVVKIEEDKKNPKRNYFKYK